MVMSFATWPRAAQAMADTQAVAYDLLDAFVAQISSAGARFIRRKPLVAVLEGGELLLHAVRGLGRVEELGPLHLASISVGARAVDLRLPVDRFLRRTLIFPDTGRNYLKPIIEHRLERLTPWSPDRVLYGFRIEPDERKDGTISVELLVTAAEWVMPVLASLEAAGLTPCSLGSAEDPLDAPPRIDLLRGGAAASNTRLRRRVGWAFAGGIFCLVPICLLAAWLAHSAEGDRIVISERLQTLQRHSKLGRSEAARDLGLIEARNVETSALVLLDRLSAALPDHSTLRELEIGVDKVRLVGRSGDASSLIGRLESEGGLTSVRFAAPVTRNAERQEVFDIVASRPLPLGKSQ